MIETVFVLMDYRMYEMKNPSFEMYHDVHAFLNASARRRELHACHRLRISLPIQSKRTFRTSVLHCHGLSPCPILERRISLVSTLDNECPQILCQ
jgi:hypothetical protein